MSVITRFLDAAFRKKQDPPNQEKIVVNLPSASDYPRVRVIGPEEKEKITREFMENLRNACQTNALLNNGKYAIISQDSNPELRRMLVSFLRAHARNVESPKFACNSGARVRSKGEKLVADAFTTLGYSYIAEPIIVFFGTGSKIFFKVPDFCIPKLNYLIHEHFGYEGNGAYTLGMIKKKNLFDSFGLLYSYTLPEDEKNILESIKQKISRLG